MYYSYNYNNFFVNEYDKWTCRTDPRFLQFLLREKRAEACHVQITEGNQIEEDGKKKERKNDRALVSE